ncbi:unnamed protein product [Parajaminaea phylloscopi]
MPPRKTRVARAATDDADGATVQAAAAAAAAVPNDDERSQSTVRAGSDERPAEDGVSDRAATDDGGPEESDREQDNASQVGTDAQQYSGEESHLKILLATDNHVGYMERDPVRGQDSINTFREILKLAVERDVDMILLGGDLFHENKPSRSTLHQVMASLRQHCLSDKPVSVELLSDPNDGKAEGYDFPAINYEDPNLNVGIPVFSIHGNHDDPQGVGVEGALSALDVLSVSGLVNYFGKVELPSDDATAHKSSTAAPGAGGLSDVGIRIRPVLLQKGNTKLALYGMGNIKDERMHYELRSNRVRMYRPRENPDDWFNILVVHQNRAAHNPKACVPETMFDDSVHLVVWGHEHEQLLNPQPVGGKSYRISQPGSSIATSLSAGETAEKCVGIIHVQGTDYRMEPIPLQTVRPFVMDDMSLTEEAKDAGINLTDKAAVQQLLRRRVYELIDKSREDWQQKYADIDEDQRPAPMLPLIRLRVEYGASLELSNPIRFGQEFVDKVANPKDVLQFTKKRATMTKKQRADAEDPRYDYHEPDIEDMAPDGKFERIKIGGLVKDFLSKQNLELLSTDGLERAIVNFVEKDDRDAIQHFVKGMTKTLQGQLNSMQPDEDALAKELDRIRDETHRNRRARSEDDFEDEPTREAAPSRSKSKPTSKRAQADSDDSMLSELRADQDDGLFSEDEDEGDCRAPPPRTTSRSKATASSRARQSAMFLGNDDDEKEEEEEEEEARQTSRNRASSSKSRADVLATKPAKKSSSRAPARSSAATGSTRPRGGRTAAAKARQNMNVDIASDDDVDAGDASDGFVIDEEASQAAAKTRKTAGTSRRRI